MFFGRHLETRCQSDTSAVTQKRPIESKQTTGLIVSRKNGLGSPRLTPTLVRSAQDFAARARTKSQLEGASAAKLCECALLFCYLDSYFPESGWEEEISRCLCSATTQISIRISNALFGGLAGIGWILEHIRKRYQSTAVEGSDPLQDIDTRQPVSSRLALCGAIRRQRTCDKANHMIHQDEPKVVVDTIQSVVTAARAGVLLKDHASSL